jgi:microcystin-dependent protein
MAVESATYIGNLTSSNPVGATDLLAEGDDHIRLLKATLQATFPNATKPFRFPSGIAAQTGTVNVTTSDANKLIPVNAAGGGITVNLPAIADAIYDGLEVIICKSDYSVNLVTIDGNSSDTINGRTTLVLRRPFQHARLRWNHTASAWFAQVDPVIPAGATKLWGSNTAPDGWVFCNGVGTIGSASSGADLAAAYTEQLFTHWYGAFDNTRCPVSGGRGASAAADYAANKRITAPDFRAFPYGNPEMGGVTASTDLTDAVAGVDVSTLGIRFGAEDLELVEANIPEMTTSEDAAGSPVRPASFALVVGTQSGVNMSIWNSSQVAVDTDHTHTVGTASGDLEAINKLPPGFIVNFVAAL